MVAVAESKIDTNDNADVITQSGEPKVKKNVKDSVFVKLFGEQKYLLQLYKELHPEDTDVTEKNIKTQSLQTTFVNTLYNDWLNHRIRLILYQNWKYSQPTDDLGSNGKTIPK